MTPILAKLIVLSLSLALVFSAMFPILTISIYVFFKPLIQPASTYKYTILGQIPLASIFSGSLIASTIFTVLFKKNYKITNFPIIMLLSMLFFSLLSFINSIDYLLNLGGIIKIITAISLYILTYNSIKEGKEAKKILSVFAVSSIIPILYGFYQYITGTGHAWLGTFYKGNRIDSFIGQYNEYGIFLCLSIIATLIIFFWSNSRKAKVLWIILLILQTVSLILSLNRGSWICLFIGFVVSILFYWRFANLKWIFVIFLIITLSAAPTIIKRFQALDQEVAPGYSQNTLQDRVDTWKVLLPLALKEPLTGFGIDNSTLVTAKYLHREIVPHNDYLRILLETGIFPLIFYFIFLVGELITFIKLRRISRNDFINFPIFAMIVYFILISFTQNIIYNQILFPTFLGLLAVARKTNVDDLTLNIS